MKVSWQITNFANQIKNSRRERKVKTRSRFGGLLRFVVDSIERWLSSFSGVPCPRDSDRAAQVCNYTITNLSKKKKINKK